MPNTRTRFLTWPKIQAEGVDVVLEPDILDFLAGSGIEITVAESPSRRGRITITSQAGAIPIQTDATAFGAKVYDCLYAQPPDNVGGGAMAPTAGRVYAMFFELTKARTLDDFWIRYNTGSGSAKESRVGIYSVTSDTNRYPKTNLLDVTASGTGLTHIASAGSLVVQPGWYWQVVEFNTTFQVVYTIPTSYLGSLFSATGGPARIQALRFDQTYGAFPATFPAGATVVAAGGQLPFVGTSFSA